MRRREASKQKRPGKTAANNRTFSVTVSSEEYELFFEAAAMQSKSGSSWARDILITQALRARWKGRLS